MLTQLIHLILAVGIGVFLILGALAVLKCLKRVTFLAIGGPILLLSLLTATKLSQFRAMGAMAYKAPAEPVTTAVAIEQDWESTLPAVGTLNAVQGVTVSAQLDGNAVAIPFEPGSQVAKGDLLLQQDTSSETAQLHAAQAAAELAQVNLARSRQLLANATISQSQFDADNATYKQALAQVELIRATIEKKTIRAPFAGRLGIRLVNVGQTLRAGDAIVSLQALDPIYADFYVPQQEVARLLPGSTVRVSTGAEGSQAVEGRLTAVNPDVDGSTRNVKAEATLSNPGEKLRPGMFVQVSVVMPEHRRVLVIPATAILYAPYGNSVFVIEETKDESGATVRVVHQRTIRLGEARGDFVVVLSGIKAGDVIVSTGAFKLRNGIHVRVDNALAPNPQENPNLSDS